VGSRRGHPLNRALDVAIAGTGLAITSPVLALAALAVKLGDGGPVLYRQTRVGKDGRDFELLKLRTMVVGAETQGAGFAVDHGDSRITRVGRFLRRSKLDELPQLIDVLVGDMSLVGPRPEVPQYVARYPAALRDRVLALKPGITDPVSLAFVDESALLARAPDPEREYVEVILPRKLHAAAAYAERATLITDLQVIARTLRLLLQRSAGRGRPAP
jgi:lipopolysaccharide/colanic/teichoic acid biosynthesis glycosyltransferase